MNTLNREHTLAPLIDQAAGLRDVVLGKFASIICEEAPRAVYARVCRTNYSLSSEPEVLRVLSPLRGERHPGGPGHGGAGVDPADALATAGTRFAVDTMRSCAQEPSTAQVADPSPYKRAPDLGLFQRAGYTMLPAQVRMRSIPFSQLQSFLAVAEAESFAGAARHLGVSRSAVSQNVSRLEEELGVTLVARTTRGVSLTDAGRRLAEATGPALSQMQAALGEAKAKPGEVVGRIRLTVPRAAFHFVIEPMLPEFRAPKPSPCAARSGERSRSMCSEGGRLLVRTRYMPSIMDICLALWTYA